MKKWLLAIIALGCIVGGVACGDKGDGESIESVAELPNVSIEELVEKNTVSEMLKNNENLQVTFTDKWNKSTILTQNVWYYSYVNGTLRVDYRYKKDGNETSELGTYGDGVYYGLQNEVSYVQFFPQEDFETFAISFAEMDFSDKEFAENALSVVGEELVLKGTSKGEDGNNYTWSYNFDKETHDLKKARALVYRPNGTFVKTQEFTYERNVKDTWERVAYNQITNPDHGQTVNVTAKYVKDGAVTHARTMSISKLKNLYAKDVESDAVYCVYADQACTQVLADLREVTGNSATIYVAEAKEGDIAARNLEFAKRDNLLSNMVEENGKFRAHYKSFDLEGKTTGEQHWYFNTNRPEEGEQVNTEDRMTFDYVKKEGSKTMKVVNFREEAFYIYSMETGVERRELALVLDADYQNVIYEHSAQYLGEQKEKTPMTKTEEGYVYVTTKQGDGKQYKTADISYHFTFDGDKMTLRNVTVEYLDGSGDVISTAKVEFYFGAPWTVDANISAYEKLVGDNAGAKMLVHMVLDHRTSNARTVSYSIYNKAYVSVYPSAGGKGYQIYRDETMTRLVTTLGDFTGTAEKRLYVVRWE